LIYASLAVMAAVILFQSYFLYKLGQDIQGSTRDETNSFVLRPTTAKGVSNSDPFVQMKVMQEDMLKSFSSFNSMFANDPFFQDAFKDMQVSPKSDIIETKENYIVELNIPGAEKQKLDIRTKGTMLHIQAVVEKHRDKKETNYMHKERYWQKFERTFTLPDDANLDALSNDYKDGVLKIMIPKKR